MATARFTLDDRGPGGVDGGPGQVAEAPALGPHGGHPLGRGVGDAEDRALLRPHDALAGAPRALPDGSSVDEVVEAMLGPADGAATPWGIGLNCTKIHKLAALVQDYEAGWAKVAARTGAPAPASAAVCEAAARRPASDRPILATIIGTPRSAHSAAARRKAAASFAAST